MSSPSHPVVHKFGGAALADAAAIQRAARIVAERTAASPRVPQVVVVSALYGVTDALVALADRAATGEGDAAREDARRLARQHRAVIDALAAAFPADAPADVEEALADARRAAEQSFEELGRVADGLAALRELTPTSGDAVVARGERLSARIFVAVLRAAGVDAQFVDATEVVMTDGQPGNAFPDLARTAAAAQAVLLPLLKRGTVPVVPGFIGAGVPQDGTAHPTATLHAVRDRRGPRAGVVTLGRGGSDLTATALARALGASEVALWKDVPGLLTADPRVVESARVIPAMHASEASELAYHGAKVLHPRALIPLTAAAPDAPPARARIVLRPFADPSAEGTVILPHGDRRVPAPARVRKGAAKGKAAAAKAAEAPRHPVKAVSALRGQALVTIRGTGMAGVPGIAARAFAALERVGVSVSLISQASSEQSICLAVPNDAAAHAVPVLREAFTRELARGEVEGVELQPGVATVAVVGSGMAGVPGIAARLFNALADAGINIVAIAQGSSELNISVVVADADAAAAQRAVHAAFRLDRIGGGAAKVPSHADVVLLGVGKVGRELARQLAAARRAAGGGNGGRGTAPFEVVGVIDSTGYVFEPEGLSPRRLAALARDKADGRALAELPGGHSASALAALDAIAAHALSRPILVDVTAGDTSRLLGAAVAHGMDLVLANKRPLAESAQARALEAAAGRDDVLTAAAASGRRVLHEATVGAGLPVIDTIKKLTESGDQVLRIEGCPSGTLGFLFAELGRGRPFSEALADAAARGYTEPDPRDDLSGMDVARKAVILARLVGWRGGLDDVAVESLVPEAMRGIPTADFVARVAAGELDAEWARRVADARAEGRVLRYRAEVTPKRVRVGVVEVDASSPFSSLTGTDNQFVFTTKRYKERPLVITGPGAGPEVTAAGVLNDVLSLAGAR